MDIKLDYTPHDNQKMLHDDKHRYIVICAGRRFGKSVFARYHVLLNALYDPGLYWIVNPTYRQGKMIHWRELKKEIPAELIVAKNEQELSVELINGARIEIKGADNEDSLRGVGIKGVVFDEAAFQQSHVFWDIIRPTLLDSMGWALFISTPKGFNWFYDLWLRGQPGTATYDPDWASYKFTSYDNPYLSVKEIEQAKRETDEDSFSQEYMAEFKKFKGLIYRNFDRKVHVIEPFEIPFDGSWEMYRAVDFGYNNPTACLWVGISPENDWYIADEYYENKESSDYHCGQILAKSGAFPSVALTYCDPAGAQQIKDWPTRGVYLTAARREMNANLGQWVGAGIDIVQELLKVSPINNKPRLFIFKHCKNTIREFESYEWEEERDEMLNKPGRPKKAQDHALDALRYLACSYQGKQVYYPEESKKNWRVGT